MSTNAEYERYYCETLEICYNCWVADPETPIDLENGRCPECLTDELSCTPPEEPDLTAAPEYTFEESDSEDEAKVECSGCKEGALNQQGHMHPGGCLDDHATE